jgi:hypothetical protein
MHRTGLLVLLALAATGCGDQQAPEPPRPPVHLTLSGPSDTASVHGDSIEVSGTVSPVSATVRVRGRRVPVSGGSFTAKVGLEAGTNVIDILASAPETRPAMTAVRVRRLVTVRVPDVVGDDPTDARDRLETLGLTTTVEQTGGIFDTLLPGDPLVCETDPVAGREVDAGTQVRLMVAKGC